MATMDQPVSTQIVPASEARQKFGELIKQVYSRRSRVIVEKGGIPVSALVALPDLERWTRMDEEREERFKVLEEIRARNADKTAEEVERDVAEELAAVRRDKRLRQAS
jgi:prevent-host-death family protein